MNVRVQSPTATLPLVLRSRRLVLALGIFLTAVLTIPLRHHLFDSQRWRSALSDKMVILYDMETYHDEVKGPILDALELFTDVRGVRLYNKPWRFSFDKVLHSDLPFYKPETFITDLATDPALAGPVDLLFSTCDQNFHHLRDQLRVQWLERKPGNRFRVACFRHWIWESTTKDNIWWMERGAFTILTLGEHMSNVTRHHFDAFWDKERMYDVERERNGREIGTFYPVMRVPQLDAVDVEPRGQGTKIHSAVVQGHLDTEHRDIKRLYDSLLRLMRKDAATWGYQRNGAGAAFVEIPGLLAPNVAFKLHLLGANIPLPPSELEHVVNVVVEPSYEDMFDRIHRSDIVLPAFPPNSDYIRDKASSSMGVALSARTPMLLSAEEELAYGYFLPAFVVRRPHYMDEMEYIYSTRIGSNAYDRARHSDAAMQAGQEMLILANAQLLGEIFTRPLVHTPEDASLAVHFRVQVDERLREMEERQREKERLKAIEEQRKKGEGAEVG